MKAISIKQPWAWLILNAGKNIENRTWNTKYRGPLLIHASKEMDQAALRYYYRFRCEETGRGLLPPIQELPTGGIVGMVNLSEVFSKVEKAPTGCAMWWQGPYGFLLTDAKRIPFIPMRGKLRIFEIDIAKSLNYPAVTNEKI